MDGTRSTHSIGFMAHTRVASSLRTNCLPKKPLVPRGFLCRVATECAARGVERVAAPSDVHLCRFRLWKRPAASGGVRVSFWDILGVELSADLAQIAKRNAAIIAERFPDRTPIRIAVGDASNFPLPSGDVVLFLYNPFGAELIAKVVQTVEAALNAEPRGIYIVYYNPTAAHCFDASSLLTRCFARQIPYAEEELGYGPDESDPVIIWQGGTVPQPIEVANARLVTVTSGVRVILESA